MKTLFIVSCSQTKHPDLKAGPMPAREAYAGTAFKIAREQLERSRCQWCILSGFYGILWPDSLINDYNVKIDPDPHREWNGQFDSLKQKQYGRLMAAKRIVVLGSRLYAASAEAILGKPVESPIAGLPIGKCLQALKSGQWLA